MFNIRIKTSKPAIRRLIRLAVVSFLFLEIAFAEDASNRIFIQDYDGELFYGSEGKGFYVGAHPDHMELKHKFSYEIVCEVVNGNGVVAVSTAKNEYGERALTIYNKASGAIEKSNIHDVKELSFHNALFFARDKSWQWRVSKDGKEWRPLFQNIPRARVYDIAFNKGIYVMLGHEIDEEEEPVTAFTARSTDGETWEISKTLGLEAKDQLKWVRGLYATQSGFIGSVENGYIESDDGINWKFHADDFFDPDYGRELIASHGGTCYAFDRGSLFKNVGLTGRWIRVPTASDIADAQLVRIFAVSGEEEPLIFYQNFDQRTLYNGDLNSLPVVAKKQPTPEVNSKGKESPEQVANKNTKPASTGSTPKVAELVIPFSSEGLLEQCIGKHDQSDFIESKRQARSKDWITAEYIAPGKSSVTLLHAAVAAAELGIPISALRAVDQGLESKDNAVQEQLHDLAARIHASLGEMAWAYRHERQLKNAPEGVSSKYWIGAYIQFQQRLQSELIDARSKSTTLSFPEELLESDQQLMQGQLDAAFWKSRFNLCRKLELTQEANLAAAWVLWLSSEAHTEAENYLEADRIKAKENTSQAAQALKKGQIEPALNYALDALGHDPIDPTVLKSVYDIALATGNNELAVSVLALRWQSGDENFDVATALPVILQQGDFSLLLSISATQMNSEGGEWEAPYYLTLAARAWDLPFLESQALRALADTGYRGGLYHLPDTGKVISESTANPDWLKPLTVKQHPLPQLAPFEEALAWRIQKETPGKKVEKAFPKEQLQRLSKASAHDQLHVAYLLDLINRETYLSDCTLENEQHIAKGMLALLDSIREGTLSPKNAENLNALFEEQTANGSLKALAHCWLSINRKLQPQAIRSTDPLFVQTEHVTEQQIDRARQGSVVFFEKPWRYWIELRGRKPSSADPADQIASIKTSPLWPSHTEPALWIGWDLRFTPQSIGAEATPLDPGFLIDLAESRDEWTIAHFNSVLKTLSVAESQELITRFIDSVTYSSVRIFSYDHAPESGEVPIFQRQANRITTLVEQLNRSDRYVDALSIAAGFVYSDAFLVGPTGKSMMNSFPPKIQQGISKYGDDIMDTYAKNQNKPLGTPQHENKSIFHAAARALYPPEHPYFQTVLTMLQNGKSVSEVYQAVNKLQSPSGKGYVVTGRPAEPLKPEGLHWAQPGYTRPAADDWSAACNAYLQNRMREPRVIKNYHANGTVEVIIQR